MVAGAIVYELESPSNVLSGNAATLGTVTSFTGIDPGPGLHYTYAPSVVQTDSSTRYVYFCENTPAGEVSDSVYVSVGHLGPGGWQYGSPSEMVAPKPGTFYSVHACEPQVVGGSFGFGGKSYSWVMFFTAEDKPTNSANRLGIAFANSPTGPWTVDPTPLVTSADDYGNNSYPNDCPTYPNGQTFYCPGEPTATTIDGGRIVLAYMGNAGSPGNDTHPAYGVVFREVDLSDVPASGVCGTCFVTLANGLKEEAVTTTGLEAENFHDVSIAYDASEHEMVVVWDDGPGDTTKNAPPVTPVLVVANIPISGFLDGTGSWQVQNRFGQCLSGWTDNHNAGLVQTANGDLPSGNALGVMYTVADDNLKVDWGVWDYRLWQVDLPKPGPAAPASVESFTEAMTACPGLDLVGQDGTVSVGGSAHSFGSASASQAGAPVVGMALTQDRQGYYLVTRQGRVLAFGDARDQGSVAASPQANDVVGIALDAHTGGYWIARADGSVSGFDAPVLGSVSVTAASGPVVAIAGLPGGEGYYLVTAHGGVAAFGNALNYGSFAVPRGQSVSAMTTTPNGFGYYLVTAQGTIAAFGDAELFGPSTVPAATPVAAVTTTPDGFGYWIVTSGGVVTPAGDANSPAVPVTPPSNVVGIVAS